jgi:hypothetical protein
MGSRTHAFIVPYSSLKVVTKPTAIPSSGIFGINSFGIGGSNAHVLFKSRGPRKSPSSKTQNSNIVLYSAPTIEQAEVGMLEVRRKRAQGKRSIHVLLQIYAKIRSLQLQSTGFKERQCSRIHWTCSEGV